MINNEKNQKIYGSISLGSIIFIFLWYVYAQRYLLFCCRNTSTFSKFNFYFKNVWSFKRCKKLNILVILTTRCCMKIKTKLKGMSPVHTELIPCRCLTFWVEHGYHSRCITFSLVIRIWFFPFINHPWLFTKLLPDIRRYVL